MGVKSGEREGKKRKEKSKSCINLWRIENDRDDSGKDRVRKGTRLR